VGISVEPWKLNVRPSSGDHLQCYWNDSKVMMGKGVLGFWESFGYVSEHWNDPPSSEPKYIRARSMHLPKVIQCGQ